LITAAAFDIADYFVSTRDEPSGFRIGPLILLLEEY
jgi:hypothetical protein